MAESKNAPVTEEHMRAARLFALALSGMDEEAKEEAIAQRDANLKRRWQAEARLEQHDAHCPCCAPLAIPIAPERRKDQCDERAKLERELAEASHE